MRPDPLATQPPGPIRPAPGTLTRFDGTTAAPAPYRGVIAEAFAWACRGWLLLAGWRREGDWPDLPKAVIVAAPHTSNWDGLHMLAAAGAWRVTLRWMGKASIAAGPTGPLVRWAGIVPIDRSQSNDVVAAMTAAFAGADTMLLAVPPEGTRSAVPKWKSGFYHIAVASDVPLVFAVLDYGTNTIRLAAAFWPTGDYDADLPVIQAFYAGARGRDPAAFRLGD